ncbi:MAG: type 4a pilus biogenesis protein PilO [Thermodesulfobacteriota bacterium]
MDIDQKLNVIARMPLSRKVLLLAAIHIVIIVLFYLFLFSPANAEIAMQKNTLAGIMRNVTRTRVIAADIPKFRKEKEELDARLTKALTRLPNEREIPDLIDSISKAGRESGLDILVFQPSGERSKGFYAEVPIKMQVTSEFKSFYTFCKKVGELPRIVNIENLNISSKEDRGGTVLLSASFMATTFRFVPDGQIKKKGKKKRR